MPLRLPDNLPAIKLLEDENIFVIDETRGHSQDIRPLKIVVLNLMPLKITTETDLIRLLSNTPLQLDITFMKLKSHTSKNTPIEHMQQFYIAFDELRERKFDGMIVTGAPVEDMPFEDVTYWDEITTIFDWARTHVTSTLYICWAAQAALYHFYGIQKHPLPMKMFGIFPQTINPDEANKPLFRGFDDMFNMPQSRHTEVKSEDIRANKELTVLAESPNSGVGIAIARDGRDKHNRQVIGQLGTEHFNKLFIQQVTLRNGQHTVLIQKLGIKLPQFVEQDFVLATDIVSVAGYHKE